MKTYVVVGILTPMPTTTPYPAPTGRTGSVCPEDIAARDGRSGMTLRKEKEY